MAAATFTIEVVATGVLEPKAIDSAGWSPVRTSKPPRFALVEITPDTGDYASGGVACDILGALTEWVTIQSVVPVVAVQNAAAALITITDPDGDSLLTVNVLSTGAEHAASALSADAFTLMVFGG